MLPPPPQVIWQPRDTVQGQVSALAISCLWYRKGILRGTEDALGVIRAGIPLSWMSQRLLLLLRAPGGYWWPLGTRWRGVFPGLCHALGSRCC